MSLTIKEVDSGWAYPCFRLTSFLVTHASIRKTYQKRESHKATPTVRFTLWLYL